MYCAGGDNDFGVHMYFIGSEDEAFLTPEDAEEYDRDPEAFAEKYEDYGIIEWEKLDLPVNPGQTFYFCDYDPFYRKWDIVEEYYTYVIYEEDGGILVGDGESECQLGKDPCFQTLRAARAYVKENWRAGDRWDD